MGEEFNRKMKAKEEPSEESKKIEEEIIKKKEQIVKYSSDGVGWLVRGTITESTYTQRINEMCKDEERLMKKLKKSYGWGSRGFDKAEARLSKKQRELDVKMEADMERKG